MIYAPKTTLYSPDSECFRMYYVESGKVILFRRHGAQFEKEALIEAGETFAQNEFIAKEPTNHLAITAEQSEILEIDQSMLDKELEGLPPEIGTVLKSLPVMHQDIRRMEESLAVTNGLPCFLFILETFLAQDRPSPYRVSDIADQMESLFGISYKDFCTLLHGFGKLELATLSFDENNNDLLQIDNPGMLKALYQYLRNRNSPKPQDNTVLTKMELQALQCLVLSQQGNSPQGADKCRISFVQFQEFAKQTNQEIKLCSRALSSLCLNNIVQPVPNLGSDLAFSERHSIVFKLADIQQLVDLNQLIPKATSEFWNLCTS